jgi:hypothetical protein
MSLPRLMTYLYCEIYDCLVKYLFYLQVNHAQVEKLHAVEMDSVIPQLGFVIAKRVIKVLTVQVIKISPYINYQLTYHKLAIF